MERKKQSHPPQSNAEHKKERETDVANQINIHNSGAGQPHNANKEALGPNTKR